MAVAGTPLASLPPEEQSARMTIAARCCVCGDDDAEPIAVGDDFDVRASAENFLAMRCNRCGVVYLASPPEDGREETSLAADPTTWGGSGWGGARARRRHRTLARLVRGARAEERVLEIIARDEPDGDAEVAGGALLHRGCAGELGAMAPYDLVLVGEALSVASDPLALLREVRSVLRPGGRAAIVLDRIDTACFRLFQGRHWGGYHFPRRRFWFDRCSLGILATRAGLGVTRIERLSGADLWASSIHNVLTDWHAPRWLTTRFAPRAIVVPLLLGAAGRAARLAGGGGIELVECGRIDA